MHLNPVELIIVLLIVVVLFGGGRIAKLGGEFGTAIKEFKRGLGEGTEGEKTPEQPPSTTTTTTPQN